MPRLSPVLIGATLAVAALALANQTGLPRTLGAHPFWATQVLWIGAPIGLLLALLATLRGHGRLGLLGGIALSAAAYGTATYGRIAFAASYAEDALAGQLWYFGWIALATGAALALASLPAQIYSRQIQTTHRPISKTRETAQK
ncbi:hypothetical protein [Dinoroseobacter sp. S76]|uniref:hypothetical protein n=1 Tax=Dinoroseobacter sp. S76 TaxID=3415124 RepID=UPI003C7B13A8